MCWAAELPDPQLWEYDADRVTINEDICATAKGYEYLCEMALRKGGGPHAA